MISAIRPVFWGSKSLAALSKVVVVGASAILAGVIFARSPRAGAALSVVPFALLLLRSAHLRLLWVVVGGVLVFDSSSGFSSAKLLYLAGLAVCLGASWHSCTIVMTQGDAIRVRRAVGLAWLTMTAVVVISFPVAMLNGHSPTLWLRDVAPYLLLGAVPILAADASRRIGPAFLAGTFAVAGVLVTLAVSFRVLVQHTEATTAQVPLFTHFVFPVTLFVYASARTIYARRRRREMLRWGLVATIVFAAILVSGTRAGFLLVLPLVGMVIVGGGLRGLVRASMLAAVVAGLILLALTFGTSAGIDSTTVEARLASTLSAAHSPQQDGSLGERFSEDRVGWELFTGAPILGIGPGYLFDWDFPVGVTHQAFTLDGSVTTVAKFGIIGIIGLLTFLGLIARMVWRAEMLPEKAALFGLVLWASAYVLIANPIEDKGLGLGLIFLLALALRDPRAASPTVQV